MITYMLAFVITMLSVIAVDDLKVSRNFLQPRKTTQSITHTFVRKSTVKHRAEQHNSQDIAA